MMLLAFLPFVLADTTTKTFGPWEDYFESTEWEVVAESGKFTFNWLESPLYNEENEYLLFTDVKGENLKDAKFVNGRLYKWTKEDGVTLFLQDAGFVGPDADTPIEELLEGGSNGMAWMNGDPNVLVMAQHGNKRIVSFKPHMVRRGMVKEAKVKVVADEFDGKRLDSPNDIDYHDGMMYFTDPFFGLQYKDGSDPGSRATQEASGVYRINKENEVEQLLRFPSWPKPNGIGFTNNGKVVLGMTFPDDPHFLMYDVNEDGTFDESSKKRIESEYRAESAPIALNDGVTAFGDYILGAGPGGIYMIDGYSGEVVAYNRIDDLVSNVHVGGGYMWVTANQRVLRVKVKEIVCASKHPERADFKKCEPLKNFSDCITNNCEWKGEHTWESFDTDRGFKCALVKKSDRSKGAKRDACRKLQCSAGCVTLPKNKIRCSKLSIDECKRVPGCNINWKKRSCVGSRPKWQD